MQWNYGTVTDELVGALEGIAGKGNVSIKEEEMERYSYDEMPIPKPHPPDVVVKPENTPSVAKVLALANEKRIPVTPRGSGTGLSGGCVPTLGGIVLSLERMNRVLEIDGENFVAVVEPGLLLSDLYQAVEERGLYYPLYPGEKSASIGGNIATNAGGMRAVKYGVTRHFVLGLTAVVPTGEVVESGGKFVKCSSGYDLTQLLVGSEGTLAVITRIILRLIPPPGKREVLFIPFHTLQEGISAVPDILKQRISPVGIEFMERDIIELVEEYTGREVPFHKHEAFLMITMEADSEEAIHEASRQVQEVAMNHGAIDVFLPGSERAKRELLETREKFYHALKRFGPVDIADVVVPRSEIPEFVKRAKEISARTGMPILVYGHAGDGNVHLHPLGRGMDRAEWERKLPGIFEEIYQVGVSLGGAVSGEHGIGFEKREYLATAMDRNVIEVMKRIKRALDPHNILNPGKIFDLS
ncbi:FAD-binding oxidoreductase [Chloroflexota bacterium]